MIVRILSPNEVIESKVDMVRQRWSQHNRFGSRWLEQSNTLNTFPSGLRFRPLLSAAIRQNGRTKSRFRHFRGAGFHRGQDRILSAMTGAAETVRQTGCSAY
jgi:hypothetical protein